MLPIMSFFITTNKKLCFFSWRPIKNNSVTPYVFFHDDQRKKQQCYPLCFFFMTTNKKRQCYPLCFFSWRPIKNNSVTPCVFLWQPIKNNSVTLRLYILLFRPIKNDVLPFTFHLIKTTVLTLMFFWHDDWWKTTV